ncbi:MAG: M55 family metallopeptidase [Chloroflexi bacterium]|nr:M55 family metallopeptidase [Chloroflexota bacterium]
MRVLISVDMEGASGIATARECGYPRNPVGDPEANPDYLIGRRWLTGDVNAAVEGALDAGATSFVLHDSHGLDYRNVVLDELHPAVEVVRGAPIIFFELGDLDDSYDAAFLIAMHARAGRRALLSHVLSWPLLREVRVNGEPVGESQITAALAGHFGIPTVLITGDDVVCEEMRASTGGQIETVVVKHSLSRYAARCLPLSAARQRIREAASRAVKRVGEIEPLCYTPPITLEVDLNDRQVAWYISWMPGVQYNGDRTVAYTGDDFLTVYRALMAMFWIATSRLNP